MSGGPASSPKILLIEDNPVVANGLIWQFERQGYTVFHVLEGSDAAKVLRVDKPDLIVLDIDLPTSDPFSGPHWDGVGFIEWMHRMTESRIPIIVHSNFNPQQVQERLGDIKIDAYFKKPASISALLQAMRNALAGAGPAQE